MAAEIQVVVPTSVGGSARDLRVGPVREPFRLRKLLAIDERPALVAFVMTLRGQIALAAVFGILLAAAIPVRIAAIALLCALAVAHLSPPRRDYALLGGTLACLLLDPIWYVND